MKKGAEPRERDVKINTRVLVDPNTGEKFEVQEIQVSGKNMSFSKIWLSHVLESINKIGPQKMTVIKYLLSHMSPEGYILMTKKEISEKAHISYPVVLETVTILKNANLIKSKTGVIQFMSGAIQNDSRGKRQMHILLTYTNISGNPDLSEEGGKEDISSPELLKNN